MTAEKVAISLPDGTATAGLLKAGDDPAACVVLAHGAGAGMQHPFMSAVASGLSDRGIATLRFDFPYMHRGAKVPDRPPIAQTAVRAAVELAGMRLPSVPRFAGGKSFGGRMTSEVQAEAPLPGVRGLVFLGFPLHPAGKPSKSRAEHLTRVGIPMLFVQGSRDTLADIDLLRPVVADLRPLGTLVEIEAADHSFHVPAKSGRTDAQVLAEMLDAVADWITRLAVS